MLLRLQTKFLYCLPPMGMALLGPTSFGEKDAIELCIGLGQEHPEGVLQLSDTETFLAFLSDFNLMALLHCFAAAMGWCWKPVKLCIQPQTSMQVRNYIAARSSCPCGAQSPAPGGQVETWPLHSKPYLDNGCQMEQTRDLQDLDDDLLWEMLQAVQLEAARREGLHPQGSSHGSLRVPGVVGLPTWMMGKWPSEGEGWGPGEPAQQSASPSHANADVSHLLSMLAAGLRMDIPRINIFSGDHTPGKTEMSLEQWYHEVQYVKDHYPEAVVCESIIRLLKEAVADMARYMGPTASVNHILQKLCYFWHGGLLWHSHAECL